MPFDSPSEFKYFIKKFVALVPLTLVRPVSVQVFEPPLRAVIGLRGERFREMMSVSSNFLLISNRRIEAKKPPCLAP